MKKSIEEFLNFYTSKVHSELFSPQQTIGEVIHILNSKTILKSVAIEINIDNALKIKANEHIFSNIMMILLSNSLDEFEKNKENKIKISINIIDGGVEFEILIKQDIKYI